MASSTRQEVDPVLDLLERMESQISSMETVRPEPRSGVDSPEFRSLRDELAQAEQRGAAQLALFTEALARLRTRIPELMEEALASRFQDLEERFFTQIRELQKRTMDSFLQSAEARVGTRIAGIDSVLAEQATALASLRDTCVQSDRNVERLLQGVDRLTAELMRLSALAGAPIVTRRVAQLTPGAAAASPAAPRDFVRNEREPARRRKLNWLTAVVVPAVLILLIAGAGFLSLRPSASRATPAVALETPNPTDSQLKLASDFTAEKNYAKAESIYKSILKASPENRTAIKELASVLFKQQRYEDAATVLKSLPPEN